MTKSKAKKVENVDLAPEVKLLHLFFGKPKAKKKRLSAKQKKAAQERLDAKINRTLNSLSPREQKVVRSRYGLDNGQDFSVEGTARRLKLSKKQVATAESSAVRKIAARKKK